MALAAPCVWAGDLAFVPWDAGVGMVQHSGAIGTAKRFMVECVGPGVGLLDVDDDGDLDLYLVQGGAVEADGKLVLDARANDALFLNDGSGRFARAPDAGQLGVGFGFGLCAADVDGDGDEDLLVANLGPNEVLLNDGAGHFTRAPGGHGLAGADTDWSMGATFADVDADGDLDAYVTNYLAHDTAHEMIAAGRLCRWVGCEVPCGPQGLEPQPDRFYLNDGEGHFTEVTAAAGLGGVPPAYAFQPVFADFDQDGDPDLFVANDSVPNTMFRNDGVDEDGLVCFVEIGLVAGVALSDTGKDQAGMGVAVGDVDADGLADLVMTNFSQEPNALFHNESGGVAGMMFFDESTRRGIGRPSYFDLGWGACLFDADLDGDLDLFVANGHVYPHVDGCDIAKTAWRQCNRLFEQVAPGRFKDVTDQAGAGLALIASSRGCAAGDLDGDGDVDLVIANMEAAPSVLRNESVRAGGHVIVDLRPVVDAVGSRVVVQRGARRWVSEVRRGSSFLGVEDARVHVGLGRPADGEPASLSISVHWRDGTSDQVTGEPGGVVTVVKSTGKGVVAGGSR